MKVIGFELEDWERGFFETLKNEHEVVLTDEPVTQHLPEQYRDAEIISTFIYSDLGADSLKQFGRLKFIATRSTGFNHIDLDYCTSNDITVSNVPEYADDTVAEHVFALLLAIGHKICQSIETTRSGSFSSAGLQGFDLKGKTMGVIGTGSIGRSVAKIARGFDMKVLAFDLHPRDDAAAALGFRYVSMAELLASSDVITLHVPGNEKTRNLISNAEFSTMKEGCVLINTARGDIVDTQALLEALTSGKIAAAGLDVMPEEPALREEAELLRSIFHGERDVHTLFAGHMLTHQKNVFITPHNAFNTREAVERLLTTSVQNILSFAGGQPQNVINPARVRQAR